MQHSFQLLAAIGHQYAVIHGFQPAIAVNRGGKRFGQGADAAIHAVDQSIKHQESLLSTTG